MCFSITLLQEIQQLLEPQHLVNDLRIPYRFISIFKVFIAAKLSSFSGAGYALVHFNITIFLHLFFFNVFIARSKSFFDANPVEIIIGLPVFATFSNSGISVISGDAILYIGQFFFSKKSTVSRSKTEEKRMIFFFFTIPT